MSFENVPLNIAGPSYEARSVPVSAQRTVHFYPERNKDGLSEFILMPWPGRKAFSAGAGGEDRGMHVFQDLIYKVSGTTLFEIDSAGVQTSRGSIADTRFCTFADNGTTMMITNGNTPYSFTGTALTLETAITTNPRAVTYLNSQFILDGDDGLFSTSDPSSTTFNALNVAEPESAPDPLTFPFAYNQILELFGTKTLEPWDNTGTGNPPFARIDGGIVEGVGCLSPYGATVTPNFMYFVSFDGVANRVSGFKAEPITPPAVSRLFQTYNLSTYKAFTITFDAQRFVVFAFDEATWVFSEQLNLLSDDPSKWWFELEDRGNKWPVTSYVNHFGKRLAASGGDVLELDFDTFTDDGNTIIRERVLAVIAGETFGDPRRYLEMSKLYLTLETGVGLSTGQGDDPQIMVQASTDGGKTYGKETWISTGRLGEFNTDVEWSNQVQFKQLAIRLRMSDPIMWALYKASIDLREAGY